MTAVADIVLDEATYPRAGRDPALIARYAGAMAEGAEFPPVVVESGTGRLLDGWHRREAAVSLGRTEIAADFHTVPAGVSAKRYAATLSAKHGVPIADVDLRALSRELFEADERLSVADLARDLGRPRQTVQGWVQDLADSREQTKVRQREVRRLAVLLLTALDWPQQQIGEALGVSQRTVSNDADIGGAASDLDESLLRAALDLIPADLRPDAENVAEEWREDRIFAAWTDDERDLLKRLRDGQTVVLSQRGKHAGLIRWAEAAGLYIRIDRRSDWGNPFETPADGDRATVIRNYAEHYLPHKPSLRGRFAELRGKALGCWCAPEACHGDVLAQVTRR